jgi:hypothetical protein
LPDVVTVADDALVAAVSTSLGSRDRPRGASTVALLLLVCATAFAGGRSLGTGTGLAFGGPLQHEGGIIRSGPVRVGHTYSVPVELFNAGDGVAILDGVELIDPTPGVRVVGASVSPDWSRAFVFGRYPPPETVLQPAIGAPVADSRTHPLMLFVGVAVDGPGRYSSPGVLIRYHVGSQSYIAHVLEGFLICAVEGARLAGPPCDDVDALAAVQDRARDRYPFPAA